MRFYRTKRVRREWTAADRALASELYAAEASNKDIALALGRKPDAVRAWLHHHCRVWHEPKALTYERAIVSHSDIPRWYALGWRFAGFEDGDCVFEWRVSGNARIPGHHSVTAIHAINPLEVAA